MPLAAQTLLLRVLHTGLNTLRGRVSLSDHVRISPPRPDLRQLSPRHFREDLSSACVLPCHPALRERWKTFPLPSFS